MQIDKLKEHVDGRFDKLEGKLDDYAQQTIKNTNDLTWIKTSGSIAITLVMIPALGYLIMTLLTK